MRSDCERLQDILEAIERINRYTVEGAAAFEENELVQNWVVSHIRIIGEASYGLTQRLKAAHPEVPWAKIIGMRHILVHSYFQIDVEIVRNVLVNDLPLLKTQIGAILKGIQESA
jgi:uncharacterized protein with HEPN domain